jgi:signal transduction histidine kinase
MRTRFLSQLAHDLRTPLNVIGGALDELQHKPPRLDAEESESMLSLARRSVARIVGLTDRMSLAARLEAGTTAALQPSELVQLVKANVSRFTEGDKRRRLEVQTRFPEAPVNLQLDVPFMNALLSELLSNANRHARKQIGVEVLVDGSKAIVAIEDDGEGVTAEEKATLFEPFIERKNKTGLGIGLWLAQSLARLQGGSVSVGTRGEGQKGARMLLELPIAR